MRIPNFFNPFFPPAIKRKLKVSKNAFTLIELLLVIAILGILAAIIFVSTKGVQASARDSRRQSDLSQISKSLQAYYLANNSYPVTDNDGISLEDDTENATFTQAMEGSGYMSAIPKDPSYVASAGEYTYKYISTIVDSYTLCAKSEAKGDYFCFDQTSSGFGRVATAPIFGGWGGGSGGGFTCGDAVTFTYNGSSVTYGTVTSTNSECWLDRNLGATQTATAYNDSAAYGDLFQWGRLDDGHQVRTSVTTTAISSVDDPGHNNFILTPSSILPDYPYDWRDPQNDSLWQTASDTNNNPCPVGWRLPTEAEWNIEQAAWTSDDRDGAFASPLKLTAAGLRVASNGRVSSSGNCGQYWSSTYWGTTAGNRSAYQLDYCSGYATVAKNRRAYGFSVRCVKD